MLNFIHEKLNTYSLGAVQNDDITMLLLEYKPELYSDDKKSYFFRQKSCLSRICCKYLTELVLIS